MNNSDITYDKLQSNGLNLANIAGNVFWKKGNMLVYFVKNADTNERKWYATTHIVQGDKLPHIPYEKSQVKTMDEIFKLDEVLNSES